MMTNIKRIRSNTYTPFTPCVNDPIAQHEAASTTDEISAAELLYDVGVWISAVWTDESYCEIWPECR